MSVRGARVEAFRTLTYAFRQQVSRAALITWGAVLLLVPVMGFLGTGNTAFRDGLDVFSSVMTSPAMLVFPLLVLFASGLPLLAETQNRFAYQQAYRSGRGLFVTSRLLAAGVMSFAFWALLTFGVFVAAFYLWEPVSGLRFMPEVYNEVVPAQQRVTYSQWLVGGELAYGLQYSALVGAAAGLIAVLTASAILLIPNPFAASTIVTALYFVQSITAALADTPWTSITYAIFPFGLVQVPIAATALPWLSLLGLSIAAVVFVEVSRASMRSLQ
ncbi:hypothetical protein [Agrococcus casei]|uniref:hypothetical protein n=2 Tax=Agrococcus casei TaxID=343512 RepID=UPI001178A050|nr:hypothetical protein [Agrococcus casei]